MEEAVETASCGGRGENHPVTEETASPLYKARRTCGLDVKDPLVFTECCFKCAYKYQVLET